MSKRWGYYSSSVNQSFYPFFTDAFFLPFFIAMSTKGNKTRAFLWTAWFQFSKQQQPRRNGWYTERGRTHVSTSRANPSRSVSCKDKYTLLGSLRYLRNLLIINFVASLFWIRKTTKFLFFICQLDFLKLLSWLIALQWRLFPFFVLVDGCYKEFEL